MPAGSDQSHSFEMRETRTVGGASLKYRPAIDGLRAIAVLAVLVFHLERQWLPGGFIGVDVFFVISGFLITSILLKEYEHGSFSLWKFYQRRIARLFPAFYTVAVSTIIAASLLYSGQDFASCGTGLYTASLFVANLKYMLQGSYFIISPDAQPFLHCWSLSVEEQFYMLFPALLLLLYWKANRYKTGVLMLLCGASLAACVVMTQIKPAWAFYLLPTRAWELLAGSILANLGETFPAGNDKKLSPAWLPAAGLALIAISLFTIHEGRSFPGYRAIFPVLGTVCILGYKRGSSGWAERFLSTGPMALIGRMSYSLYLWHWPVFCFVDYRLYLASPFLRMGLKTAITVAASVLCYYFIERPGRVYLNRPGNRRIAFAFLACALMVCVPLGLFVRRTNYIDASAKDVARGGIALNQAGGNGSIVLMGDSSGSMYGVMLKEAAHALNYRLNVISVAKSEPLPNATGNNSQLWRDSLGFVKRENPDVVVLSCSWLVQAHAHDAVIEPAISELRQHTRRLILITQPPRLPETANRESMRNGGRPPFLEDPTERAERNGLNALVKSFAGGNVTVIDVEPLFTAGDGSIRFTGEDGIQLYQDADHISGAGAELVKAELIQAIKD